ncbi:MAG: heparinase II/III family protein [Planctomycetes bacterium]|nr:heparinase II/III family protein [Planctomycetota bacterium]
MATADSIETIKLRNHHLALIVWPEGARILEVQSVDTGAHLVSWWPFNLESPELAGGIGEAGSRDEPSPWRMEPSKDSLRFVRELPNGLVLEKTITLPGDSRLFTVSLAVENTSQAYHVFSLAETAAVCPGAGGACPEASSGISNCHETAVIKRPGKYPETITYEVFEQLEIEHDDLEWAAFSDPVTGNLFCALLPEGHSRVQTRYHWWLEWSNEIHLEPGERYTADFHYAATGAVDLPLVVSEYFLAGFSRTSDAFSQTPAGKVTVYGLDEAAAGNRVSVKADGKELTSGKPLPAGREPMDVVLPQWRREEGLHLEVSVAGKFGEGRLAPSGSAHMYGQLDQLCRRAVEAAESGGISTTKAATVLAIKRIVDSNGDKCADEIQAMLEKAIFEASAVLDSAEEAVPFYSEAERATQKRLADRIDIGSEVERLKGILAQRYDLSIPRFREPDSAVGAFAAAKAVFEAALVLNVHPDEDLLAAAKGLLADLTGLWRRYGQVFYETIHHGVLLCRLIPAYKLASENEWLSLDEEAEVQAMILDLAAKIRRRGSRQFRLSNWHAMEQAPLAYLGALFPYMPCAAKCLEGARDVFEWLLVHGTFADGGFWEMSPMYHWLTLEYLFHIAEAFLRTGEDLYHSDICGRRLLEMVDFLKRIAAPAGMVPALEDSGRTIPAGVLLALAKRLDDGELLFQVEAAFRRDSDTWGRRDFGALGLFVPLEPPDPRAPNRGSEVLVPSGKLIVRSPSRNLTFVFDFGPHGGWHGHSDKLSFEAFWRDVCLVPDAGSYKYEDSLQWDWFKTAPAHNTVTLGESDRPPATGRLLYFEEGRGFVTAGMQAPLSQTATHRREITFCDRALLVDDFLENVPSGEMLVWRMNSFVPIELDGRVGSFKRGNISVTVTPVSQGLAAEVAEVPLMGETPSTKMELAQGCQLRFSKSACGDSDRILVRMDFSW